jgi:type II secretory pathway pseudopilin PulG
LFVAAAAVVGGAFSSAMQSTRRARLADRAANLAQSVLTRISLGQITLVDASAATFDSDTQPADPALQGWTYDVACQEVPDATGVQSVTVTVHAPSDAQVVSLSQWMLDASGGGP